MYQLGEKALRVSASLFVKNRQNLLKRLRSLPNLPKASIVVLEGGRSENRHDTDHEEVFRQVRFHFKKFIKTFIRLSILGVSLKISLQHFCINVIIKR